MTKEWNGFIKGEFDQSWKKVMIVCKCGEVKHIFLDSEEQELLDNTGFTCPRCNQFVRGILYKMVYCPICDFKFEKPSLMDVAKEIKHAFPEVEIKIKKEVD